MAIAANTFVSQWGAVIEKNLQARQQVVLLADDAFTGTAERRGDKVYFTVDNGQNIIDTASFAWSAVDAGNFAVELSYDKCWAMKVNDTESLKLQGEFGLRAVAARARALGAKFESDAVAYLNTTATQIAIDTGDDLKTRVLKIRETLVKTNVDMSSAVLLVSPEVESAILKELAGLATQDIAMSARVNGYVANYLGFKVITSTFVTSGKMIALVPEMLKVAVLKAGEIEAIRLTDGFATGYRQQYVYGVGMMGKNGALAAGTLAAEAKFAIIAPLTGVQAART